MVVNKVVYNTENGTETLIDLTSDTVTPSTLVKGRTAHDKSGAIITGTMEKETWVFEMEDGTTIEKEVVTS